MRRQKRKDSDSLPPEWLQEHFGIVLGCIVFIAFVVYYLRNPQYRTGSFGDDAIYVIGARDFWKHAAERSPLLQRDYPFPALPLLISPFAWLVAPHWTSLELLTVFASVLLIYCFARLARQWLSVRETLAAVLLLALNPLLARLSGAVMGANYLALVVTLIFLWLTQCLEKPEPKKLLALGLVAGWGVLLRPDGVILLISLFVVMLLSRHRRQLFLWTCPPLLAWALFAYYWFCLRHFPGSDYASDVAALWHFWTAHFVEGLTFSGPLFQVMLARALTAMRHDSWVINHLSVPVIVALSVLLIMGFRSLWNQRLAQRPILIGVAIFSLMFLGMHLFWHAVVSRYAIPLLPFFIIFLVRGISHLFSSFDEKGLWRSAFIGLLVIGYAMRNITAIRDTFAGPKPDNIPPWQTMAWIKDNVRPQSVIMSDIAPIIDLYLGHTTITGIDNDNVEFFMDALAQAHIDYLVYRSGSLITPGVESSMDINAIWDRLRWRTSLYPKLWPVVYANSTEQTVVYRVNVPAAFAPAFELFKKATLAYAAHQDAEAMNLLKQSTSLYPNFASAYNFMGALYLHQRNFVQAGLCFEKAVKLNPSDAYATANLATIYYIGGRSDRAQELEQQIKHIADANGTAAVWKSNIDHMHTNWDQHLLAPFLEAPSITP